MVTTIISQLGVQGNRVRYIRAINRQIREDFQPYRAMGATLRLEGRSVEDPDEVTAADMRGDAIIYLWDSRRLSRSSTASEVLGPYVQMSRGSTWAVDDGQWEFNSLLACASGIRAGTSEILRNILGERVLGLPKD